MLICGIIKPHAFTERKGIREALKSASIRIQEMRAIYFTREDVEVLYDHMSSTARQAISKQMVGKVGIALLLCVPSIELLLEIVGTESDPSKCKPWTIRACFGVHTPPIQVGSDPWWDNAFHRPIDAREAARDLRYIFDR